MNRRGFILKLASAILGAPLAEKYAPAILEIDKIQPINLNAFFIAESERITDEIVKRVSRKSPWMDLLDSGTFPTGMGDAIRLKE